jgi:hypothetical protein
VHQKIASVQESGRSTKLFSTSPINRLISVQKGHSPSDPSSLSHHLLLYHIAPFVVFHYILDATHPDSCQNARWHQLSMECQCGRCRETSQILRIPFRIPFHPDEVGFVYRMIRCLSPTSERYRQLGSVFLVLPVRSPDL